MPDLNLPKPGDKPSTNYAAKLVASIEAVNADVDGRLGAAQLDRSIVGQSAPTIAAMVNAVGSKW